VLSDTIMCFSCSPPPSPYFPRRLQQYQLLVLREMSHMHTYIYIYIYCVMSHICLSHATCMIYIADVHHTHVMHSTQNVTHIYIYTYMCIYIFICLMSRGVILTYARHYANMYYTRRASHACDAYIVLLYICICYACVRVTPTTRIGYATPRHVNELQSNLARFYDTCSGVKWISMIYIARVG